MSKKLIQLLVLHCTATKEFREVTSNDIRLWHLAPCDNANGTVRYNGVTYFSREELRRFKPLDKIAGLPIHTLKGGRGWRQVGYRDMILLDGTVERLIANDNEDEFIDNWEITNGVTGLNTIARHVVYVGGCDNQMKPKDTRNEQQKRAMATYVLDFVKKYPHTKVAGHYHFAAKACPSFVVGDWLREIGCPEANIYGKK